VIAADKPVLRRPAARLLRIDASGALLHARRWQLAQFVEAGDVVVANDAATLPASLRATHERTGQTIEIRLAGRDTLEPDAVLSFVAVLFGAGNFRTRTEHRPLPPPVIAGDRLTTGDVVVSVEALLDHPRFVRLRFDASSARVWRLLARQGRPIQYAHVHDRLALWDAWTPIAAVPVAYEPPSAGFALDWSTLAVLRAKGVEFVTLTHAAGISSTGDAALDRRLPLPEPYFIPAPTRVAIANARARGRRVVAVGTTVVRALEHSADVEGVVREGAGLADQRIGAETQLRVVDTLLSGTHETGTSHYELLRAFLSDDALRRLSAELDANGYLTHEFGDSILIEADAGHRPSRARLRTAITPADSMSPRSRKERVEGCTVC
jgi:S-adenosylmethionine:tRNA ribosyltransferase-isomerase